MTCQPIGTGTPLGDDMASRSKSHWENWTMSRLRPEARKMGLDPKGLRKQQLIHEMRLKAQKDEKSR